MICCQCDFNGRYCDSRVALRMRLRERGSLMGVGEAIDNASVNIVSLICYCAYMKRKKHYDNYKRICILERGKFYEFNFIHEIDKK